MTSHVNETGIFNYGLAPQSMRDGKMIVFSVGWINGLAADFTLSLCALVDCLFLHLIKEPLRVASAKISTINLTKADTGAKAFIGPASFAGLD